MESARNTPEAEPTPAPGPVAESAEPATLPVPAEDVPPVPAAVPEPADDEVPPRRRRGGRTLVLLAAAAVLGIVGGVAVGYGVQAEREPTPLPPLNQVDLAYPAKPAAKGQEPPALAVADDRGLKTEGDLRKLLLPKPAGAKDVDYAPEDHWLSASSYAEDFESPSGAFEYLMDNGIRRIATTSWQVGEFKTVHINLLQFRSNDRLGAADRATTLREGLEEENGYGQPLKGSTEGRSYVLPVDREAGFVDVYEARAVVHRGDVAVEVYILDTKKISQKEITSLAERQLGRL
ncbi:hypothetical protein [Streptomyces fradiae]|uniref:hypothetical protein n=1 Tax=Streptomyces fradiae TaxID=1906 RepID=UPI003519CB46